MKSKKPKFQAFSNESGKKLTTAYMDGYAFGDRLLEGVMFQVSIRKDGTLTVAPARAQDKEHLEGLNAGKWLRVALDFAHGSALFSEEPEGGSEDFALEEVGITLFKRRAKPSGVVLKLTAVSTPVAAAAGTSPLTLAAVRARVKKPRKS
jgi:hypothetical protein